MNFTKLTKEEQDNLNNYVRDIVEHGLEAENE